MRNLRLAVQSDRSILEGLIRNAVNGVPGPLDWVFVELGKPDLDEAWAIVDRSRSEYLRTFLPHHVASGRHPRFDCIEIADAVEIVGWVRLCFDEPAQRLREDFLQCYGTLIARLARDAHDEGNLNCLGFDDSSSQSDVG